MDKKKIIKKYFVDGKLLKKDHDRLARKGVDQAFGGGDYSEATGTAASYVVPAFQEQERKQKSIAGSANKKKMGIWNGVQQHLASNPDYDADSLWTSLDHTRVDFKWELWIDEDRIYQSNLDSDKTVSIKKSTFIRHYYNEIKSQ